MLYVCFVWVSLDRGLQILNTSRITEAKFVFSPIPSELVAYLFHVNIKRTHAIRGARIAQSV